MRSLILVGVPLSLVLLIAAFRVAGRAESSARYEIGWIATRPLMRNHQIRRGDLAYPGEWLAAARLLLRDESMEGRHVTAEIPRSGERVGASEVSLRPNLTTHSPDAQVYFYVLKEDATPVGGWTEGASVIPCYSKTEDERKTSKVRIVCIHSPLPILAVHASGSTGDASWLAIEVPGALRCKFAEFALAEKRLLFQVFK